MTDRDRLVLEPIANGPQVGLLIAALEDGRRRILCELASVHHLVQHEAEHRAHIALIRDLLAAH